MSVRPRLLAVLMTTAAAVAFVVLPAETARAAANSKTHDAAALALFLGSVFVAVATSIMLLRTRRRAAEQEEAAAAEIANLKRRLDLAETLTASDAQITIVWRAGEARPEVVGDATALPGAPAGVRLLAFGSWLDAQSATSAEAGLEALRRRGEPFRLMLRTRQGGHVEADGRPVGAAVTIRLRDVSGERLARAEIEAHAAELAGALARFTALAEALPQPVWMRDGAGRLAYANKAYARAVEAEDGAAAADKGAELLEQAERAAARHSMESGHVFRKRTPAVFAGARRIFDVVEAPSSHGSAAIAVDVSELEDVHADLSRLMAAHRRTLDELATAVAIFSADGVLVFHNNAFRQLWSLEPAFLDSQPTDPTILDRLRAERKLPEQADFRTWKAQLHEAYRALESREHWWHLPDGRTLRVVAAPNPQGGVTYLFDDVTERLALESRFNALTKVQRETIDHLKEAVAVFGSDGRLRLHNPAFETMWRLDPTRLGERPHAEDVLNACRANPRDMELWTRLKTATTAMPEERKPLAVRIERDLGGVIDVVTLPLPDGGTLVTFTDVTASVQIERALRERAEAVEAAVRLKNEFTSHVSYELRSPLTNIIGFGQLLGDPRIGELSQKQRDYVDHILQSSSSLLAIINDILDLTTIDAGAMSLDLEHVNARKTIDAAVEGLRDRLSEAGLGLEIDCGARVGDFIADGKRVRQVLFNLLSNAIGFSKPGLAIKISAKRVKDAMVFKVTDRGAGIPAEHLDSVFERFESRTEGGRHRGVGLGLSIARSLVELHGGNVSLTSIVGEGTTVICSFPLIRLDAEAAAE